MTGSLDSQVENILEPLWFGVKSSFLEFVPFVPKTSYEEKMEYKHFKTYHIGTLIGTGVDMILWYEAIKFGVSTLS